MWIAIFLNEVQAAAFFKELLRRETDESFEKYQELFNSVVFAQNFARKTFFLEFPGRNYFA